ncbi:unnamed protein product [Auanema sp. JU1783]|nr:unnamed protein product [Auanema sp. JU1783]
MNYNRFCVIFSIFVSQIYCELEKQSNVSSNAQPVAEATIIEVRRETHEAAVNEAINDAPHAQVDRRSVADDDEAAVLLKQTVDDPENSSVALDTRQKRRTVRKMTKARTKSQKHKNTPLSSNGIQ